MTTQNITQLFPTTDSANGHEIALIGMCLQAGSIEDALTVGVTSEMFQLPQAREAWVAMCDLNGRNMPLDLVSVASRASTRGNVVWLSESLSDAPIGECRYYALEVVNAALNRRIASSANKILQSSLNRKSFDPIEPIISEFASAQTMISQSAKMSFETRDVRDVIDSLLADLVSESKHVVMSGFKSIDQKYGGFMAPDLWIVAARPSMGKTTFAVNCACNAAALGKAAVYFTAEMRDTQIALKELSRIARVPLAKIRSVSMSSAELDRFHAATEQVCSLPLSVNFSAAKRIEGIENETRRLHRLGRCNIVFIDYLQLIHASGRWDSRHSEITYITGRLKSMAIDLNIPVVACAQVNRELDKTGKKPNWRSMLTMLKDSGSIEQDADVVMFIEGEERASEVDLIFAKVRHGEKGKTRCAANLAINSFSDAEYRFDAKE